MLVYIDAVLRSEGARYVFGNPGTTELPLIDALVEASDISYVWALQEASAVAMADGYAQAAALPPPVRGPRCILLEMAYRGQGVVTYFAVRWETPEWPLLALCHERRPYDGA